MRLTFDLLRIGGTGVMCVYLFRGGTLIQAHKPVKQVFAGGVVIISARVIREVVTYGRKKRLVRGEENGNIEWAKRTINFKL